MKKRKKRWIKRRPKRSYRRGQARKIKRRKGSLPPPLNGKLTRRRRIILFEALALGMTRKSACALAGINSSTFGDYMDYGKDPELTKYYHFRKKVQQLEAQREKDALHVIRRAGNGGYKVKKTKISQGPKGMTVERTTSTLAPQWHAAAWFLERKKKQDWGREAIQMDRTPEEYARDIKETADLLFNSVPTNGGEDIEAGDST